MHKDEYLIRQPGTQLSFQCLFPGTKGEDGEEVETSIFLQDSQVL